jgi:hypothetical protein
MMRFHQGYNSARIKPISTYDEAKERYEKTTPIRGSDNVRPLGDMRRYRWIQIKHKQASIESPDNPLGEFVDTYVCHMWGTDYITYYPNGDLIINAQHYRGVSVMNMLTYALAGVGRIGSKRGKWYFVNKQNQSFVINDYEPTVFRRDGETLVPVDTRAEYVYRLNRKEMNALRKKYKAFVDYATTALAIDSRVGSDTSHGNDGREITAVKQYFKMNDSELLPTNYWNRRPDTKANRTTVIQALDKFVESGDLELGYNLMYLIAFNAGKYSYRNHSIHCSPQAFKKYFEEVLKYHFSESLFKEEEVVIGMPFHDGNEKYISSKE